jgi:hypothetical protein
MNELQKLINQFPNKPWNWKSLSLNPNITWIFINNNLFVNKLRLKPWNWDKISQNPNITWNIINNNLNIPWNWKSLSKNINITWNFIINNLFVNKVVLKTMGLGIFIWSS